MAQLQSQAQQLAREKDAAEAQAARVSASAAVSRKNSMDSSAAASSVGGLGAGVNYDSKPGTPNSMSNTSAFNQGGNPPQYTAAQSNAILQLKNANKFLTAQKEKFKGEAEKAAAELRRASDEGH